MINDNFKAIKGIFFIILLLIFSLWTMLFYDSYESNKRIDELKEKIEQVELDYKFLKYNKEQLEEMK